MYKTGELHYAQHLPKNESFHHPQTIWCLSSMQPRSQPIGLKEPLRWALLSTPAVAALYLMATSPVPSREPKRGRNCYITPQLSGVPNKGEQNKKWLPKPSHLGGQKRVELLRNPWTPGGPECQTRGKNQQWLPHRCILGGPNNGGIGGPQHQAPGQNGKMLPQTRLLGGRKVGQNCYVTQEFPEVPNTKSGDIIRSGYLSLPFSRA